MIRAMASGSVASLTFALAAQAQTIRVDVDAHGLEAVDGANSLGDQTIAMSRDGRFVVYQSGSANLGSQGVNGNEIFVRDRQLCLTELVSVNSSGVTSSDQCAEPAISDDGRFVVFASADGNLVLNDDNHFEDIFLRDRQLGTTVCVSVDPSGAQSNGSSFWTSISADGRFVAFSSQANNLVPNDTNGFSDVFLRDVVAGTTSLVSVNSLGVQGNGASVRPVLSADARYLVFDGGSTNLVANLGTGFDDVYRRDLQLGTTELVSVNTSGDAGNSFSMVASLSDDGQRVAFQSLASDLVANDQHGNWDIFVRDFAAGTTTLVSSTSSGVQGNQDSLNPWISSDGRYVSFSSNATNLSSGDTNAWFDAFVKDLSTGLLTRVSNDSNGVQGDADPNNSTRVAAGGRSVAFLSSSPKLVIADTNQRLDVFVTDPNFSSPGPQIYCTAKTNSLGCRPMIGVCGQPSITGFDEFVVNATNVLNSKAGIFFWGTTTAANPFGGGTLCVKPPIVRTAVQSSGGDLPPMLDCTSGVYVFHFSQNYMSSVGLAAGATLYGQFWSRDPGFVAPNNIGLTDAVQFTIGP